MLVVSAAILIVIGVLLGSGCLMHADDRYYNIWLHWMLGLFLFVLLFRLLSHLVKADKKHAVVMHVDKISYEVYLTHHPLILGPLSMMFISRYNMMNILLMLITVYILSRLLHYYSSFTQKIL